MKVRFAISKSTLAAAFIAVFFVASEAAQQFLGDRFESDYLRILPVGALVFAITPLSRVADRLAAKAVPLGTGPEAEHAPNRPGTTDLAYRAAVRAAVRDGLLTRREEIHLAQVAEGLGIGPRRALELRGEVEEETD